MKDIGKGLKPFPYLFLILILHLIKEMNQMNMPNVIESPLIFKYQICPNCNSVDQLVFIDQYKKRTSNPIYPATVLVCEKCGKEFPIYWKSIDGELTPYPGEKDKEKEAIQNIIKLSLENVRKLD